MMCYDLLDPLKRIRASMTPRPLIFYTTFSLTLLSVSGCHMIPSDDERLTELNISRSDSVELPPPCSLVSPKRPEGTTLFSAWWEGEWELNHATLTDQLSALTQDSRDHNLRDLSQMGVSLAQAFAVRVYAQHAELEVDGRSVKLASAPLKNDRGVRLVGAQRELFLWCEGDQVYWRVESGERFALRRVAKARRTNIQ